jgi:hypothetical protein
MHGREAVRRYLADWIDIFDDITNVPEELLVENGAGLNADLAKPPSIRVTPRSTAKGGSAWRTC